MAHSIAEFGARGDGQTLNTAAIQKAIDSCCQRGGGRVVVPSGVFVTGTLELFSHLTLELEAGAVLKGSADIADYPPHRFHHNEWGKVSSLLYAIEARNVAIVGEGTIDLNGSSFMDFEQIKTGDTFEADVLSRATPEQRAEATVVARARPNQLLFFHGIENCRIEGITIRDSPCWTITFSDSRDVKIRGVSIDGDLRVPNNDGIHLTACKDVVISDCVLSCGDDCIAITSITKWDEPSERIAVTNCSLVSRSAAVRLGHLASKVHDVVLTNLVIRDSQRGVGIFAGDGGLVENVLAHNLVIETRIVAGHWWGNGEPLVISAADGTGAIRNVRVAGVMARCENGVVVYGNRGNVSDVDLVDWRLELSYGNNRPLLGKLIDLQPAQPRAAADAQRHIPWLIAHQTRELGLRHVRYGRHGSEDRRFSVEAVIDDSSVVSTDVTER